MRMCDSHALVVREKSLKVVGSARARRRRTRALFRLRGVEESAMSWVWRAAGPMLYALPGNVEGYGESLRHDIGRVDNSAK